MSREVCLGMFCFHVLLVSAKVGKPTYCGTTFFSALNCSPTLGVPHYIFCLIQFGVVDSSSLWKLKPFSILNFYQLGIQEAYVWMFEHVQFVALAVASTAIIIAHFHPPYLCSWMNSIFIEGITQLTTLLWHRLNQKTWQRLSLVDIDEPIVHGLCLKNSSQNKTLSSFLFSENLKSSFLVSGLLVRPSFCGKPFGYWWSSNDRSFGHNSYVMGWTR